MAVAVCSGISWGYAIKKKGKWVSIYSFIYFHNFAELNLIVFNYWTATSSQSYSVAIVTTSINVSGKSDKLPYVATLDGSRDTGAERRGGEREMP